ncbi:fam-e protein [Plasmodium gallinaceum]|uniref:Fam-e protein n=1 Tax=Plasmodium gallinaceum TaxID=5849 RepID=A0A1J1GTA0_PLAGA|nr:fam-e protein [Plasmodium gallinaceum]CRG95456.1 fam-e protein [Plasmodium gallinaceum]
MALLYNKGCKKSNNNLSNCDMHLCPIYGGIYQTIHCSPAFIPADVRYLPSDLSKNEFLLENFNSEGDNYKVTVLSENESENIVFLLEYISDNLLYFRRVYLCRLKTLEQKVTLCALVNDDLLENTITFNSFDVIDRKNERSLVKLKSLKNPKHETLMLDYKDIYFSKDACYVTELGLGSLYDYVCRYSICEKHHKDHMTCKDAKFNGKVIHLGNHSIINQDKEQVIYLPDSCLKHKLKFECTPYFCEYSNMNELKQCKGLEISAVKNVIPKHEGRDITGTNSKYMIHKSNKDMSILAASFIPFLILVIFIACYIYRAYRRNRKRGLKKRDKEP